MRTLRFGPLFLLAAIVLSGLVTPAASPARSSDQGQPAAFNPAPNAEIAGLKAKLVDVQGVFAADITDSIEFWRQ